MRIEGSFAGSAYFDLDFYVIPSENTAFKAEAFLCDERNQVMKNPGQVIYGNPIRVCIRPDEEARSLGITMHSIDSFYFKRDTNYQYAVKGNGDLADFTMVNCVPGSSVCAFRIRLIPQYFESNGKVIGAGKCSLEYATDSKSAVSRRLIADTTVTTLPNRELQKSDQVVSDQSDLNMEIRVAYTENLEVFDDPCDYNYETSEWWVEAQTEDRYVYIGIIAGSLVGVGVCLLCAWILPSMMWAQDASAPPVNVNPDVDNSKNATQINPVPSFFPKGFMSMLRKEDTTSEESEANAMHSLPVQDERSQFSGSTSMSAMNAPPQNHFGDSEEPDEKQPKKSSSSRSVSSKSIRSSSTKKSSSSKKSSSTKKSSSSRNLDRTPSRRRLDRASSKRSISSSRSTVSQIID